MSNDTANYYRVRSLRAWLFTKHTADQPPGFLSWSLGRWPEEYGLKFYPNGTGSNEDGYWGTAAHMVYNGRTGKTRWSERTMVIEDHPLRFVPEDEFQRAYERVED